MSDENVKDYLAGQYAAQEAWTQPIGTKPLTRYKIGKVVNGVLKRFEFFTYMGAVAYLEGELRGRGEIIAL